jgi:hypothetical protein
MMRKGDVEAMPVSGGGKRGYNIRTRSSTGFGKRVDHITSTENRARSHAVAIL